MRALLLPLAAVLAGPAFAQVNVSPAAPIVVIRPLAEIAIYPEREASAQVMSLNESRIAAEISGRIEAIPVRVGARVARARRPGFLFQGSARRARYGSPGVSRGGRAGAHPARQR